MANHETRDSNYLRAKAEECRRLATLATDREILQQLLTWACEFDEAADRAELAEKQRR